VIEAFTHEGFLLKSLDVSQMVRGMAGRDLRRYVLLQAIHPDLTWQTLRLDPDAGVVVPCHIAVYELGDGQTVVTTGDPMSPSSWFGAWRTGNPGLAAIAEGFEGRIASALGAVSHTGARSVNAA
jgi:uncharacterized protein (DUF302 family)